MCIYIYMVESVVFGVSDDLRVALTPRPTSFLSLPLSLAIRREFVFPELALR